MVRRTGPTPRNIRGVGVNRECERQARTYEKRHTRREDCTVAVSYTSPTRMRAGDCLTKRSHSRRFKAVQLSSKSRPSAGCTGEMQGIRVGRVPGELVAPGV